MKNMPARERRRARVPGPYGRKQKAPYRYSGAHAEWHRAAKLGHVPPMLRAYTVRGMDYHLGSAVDG